MPIPLANVVFPLILTIFIFVVNYKIGLQNLKLIPTPIQKIFELSVEFIFDLLNSK
jgi:F0F1-type ATP synthase membrane subunit a